MSDGGSKQQTVSPRRRREAREQGQVPRSGEFIFAVMYGAAASVLLLCGPRFVAALLTRFERAFSWEGISQEPSVGQLQQELAEFAWGLLPLLTALVLAVVLAHWVQHGPLWLPGRLRIDPDRVNPAQGMHRLLQTRPLAGLGLGGAKVLVLTGVAIWLAHTHWHRMLSLSAIEPVGLGRAASELGLRCAAWMGLTLIVWGGLDFAVRLYWHERDLQSNPESLQDEIKAVHNDLTAAHRRRQRSG